MTYRVRQVRQTPTPGAAVAHVVVSVVVQAMVAAKLLDDLWPCCGSDAEYSSAHRLWQPRILQQLQRHRRQVHPTVIGRVHWHMGCERAVLLESEAPGELDSA